MPKRYLLWFAHEHLGFRRPEIDSILSLFDIKIKFLEEPLNDVLYWIVELESEDLAKKIASRSISLRWCIELWGRAKTSDKMHKILNESIVNSTQDWISSGDELNSCIACPKRVMEPHFSSKNTFKFTVETFCKHFQNEEKIKKIENFNYMPFKGSVSLKNPEVDIMFLEYYGLDPNNIPETPHDVFVGRRIAEGQRNLISKLSLKHRKFIGNTSMDAQLSVLMANQAQVKYGDTVIDPFVGSGSLLVAASEFGGYVWGTDIDFLMLHARSRPTRIKQKIREKDESIKANMQQYKRQHQYLDVVVSDFSMPLWRTSLKFDAIITDPPYGIRESTEKIGIERQNYSLSPEHLVNHIPSKIDYNLPEIFEDLLNFAALHLCIGKKLVFWYPCYRGDYDVNKLPRHPCLKLIANSEQILSKLTARRLLTYEKTMDLSNNNLYSPEKTYNTNGISEDDFRTKYFNSQDQTRKERKEESKRKLEESIKYIKIRNELSKNNEGP